LVAWCTTVSLVANNILIASRTFHHTVVVIWPHNPDEGAGVFDAAVGDTGAA
jgi:hypothetical protein